MSRRMLGGWLICGCCLLVGCDQGKATSGGGKTGEAAVAEEAVKKIAADTLPSLGEPLPEQDDGRIVIAPPKGWHVMSRDKNYLGVFTEKEAQQYPAIAVKGGAPITAGFDNVSESNAIEFAEALKKAFQDKYGDKYDKNIAEDPRPMMIGNNAMARYVQLNRTRDGKTIEVQALATVRGGRHYTVELRVLGGEIPKHKNSGYAVGAGLKFNAATSSAPAESKEEAKPAEEAAKPEEKAEEKKE